MPARVINATVFLSCEYDCVVSDGSGFLDVALQPHKQEVISASRLHLRVNIRLAILW